MSEVMDFIRACCFGQNENIIKVNWEITGKCQLRCKHCLNKHRRNSSHLSLKKAKIIVEELVKYKVTRIIFTGGEPLLYNDIFELIKYAQSYKIDVSLNTNGLLLEKYFSNIIDLSPLKIRIGLCGFSPNTHDNFNGNPGSFNQVMSYIIKLLPYNLIVSLQYTLTKNNIHELPDLINFLKKHNMKAKLNDIIKVENVENNSFLDDYIISEEDLKNIVNSDILKDNNYIDIIRPQKGNLQKCPAGKNIFGILPDGKVTPCSWISSFTTDYNSENIKDVFSFPTVMESLFNNSLCNNCNISDCGKGCIAIALKYQPNIDPLCPILE